MRSYCGKTRPQVLPLQQRRPLHPLDPLPPLPALPPGLPLHYLLRDLPLHPLPLLLLALPPGPGPPLLLQSPLPRTSSFHLSLSLLTPLLFLGYFYLLPLVPVELLPQKQRHDHSHRHRRASRVVLIIVAALVGFIIWKRKDAGVKSCHQRESIAVTGI